MIYRTMIEGKEYFFYLNGRQQRIKITCKRVLYSLFGMSFRGITELEDQKVAFCSFYSVLIFIPCNFCFALTHVNVMASEPFSNVCNFNVNSGKKGR